MYNAIICRYHEIATKGDNRSFFERTMLENLKRILRDEFPELRYRRVRGRLYMEFADKRDFESAELDRISEVLQLRALGIENFSPAIITAPDMENIKEIIKTAGETIFPAAIEKAHKEVLNIFLNVRKTRKKFSLTYWRMCIR